MLDRLRTSPRVFPLVAAPVLGVLGVVEASADPEFRDTFWQLAVVAAWLAASFLVAAWYPSVGAALVSCFYPLTALLGAPGPGGTGLIAAMLAMGYVGYAAPPRRSMVAVTVGVLVFIVTSWVVDGFGWDTVFFPVVFYPARWAGRLVSRERERSAQLVELTALLDAQRETAAQAAAQEERTRIAREVHDAVAHSVSVMTLQIGGLRRQLGEALADRPQEREVLLGLERLGRETVEELRSLVGILREPGHTDSSTAPVPSLSRAEDVVADVRAAGLDVELEVRGDAARAAAGARPLGVPDPPGGAHQRAAPRAGQPGARAGGLRARRRRHHRPRQRPRHRLRSSPRRPPAATGWSACASGRRCSAAPWPPARSTAGTRSGPTYRPPATQ